MNIKNIINTQTGVIAAEHGDANSITMFDSYKEFMLKNSRNAKVRRILLHPVGQYCKGDCFYCMNKHREYKGEIDLDNITKAVKYLNDNDYLSSDLRLTYSGGNPFLHSNLKCVNDFACETIKNITGKYPYKINYFCDGIIPRDKKDDVVEILTDSLNYSKFVRITSSLDLGTTIRHSKTLNLTSSNVIDNVAYIVEKTKETHEHFVIINYTNDIDIISCIDQIDKFLHINPKTIVLLRLAITPENNTNANRFFKNIETLKEKYDLVPNTRERGYFIFEKGKANYKYTEILIYTQAPNNSLFKISPSVSCTLGTGFGIGVGDKPFFTCFFGTFEFKEPDAVFPLNERLAIEYFLNKGRSYCSDCDIRSFCPYCNLYRSKNDCGKGTYMYDYVKYILNDRLDCHSENSYVLKSDGKVVKFNDFI